MIGIALALFFLCLMISFLFSGVEAGILSVNRVRLRHRLNLGDRSARQLDRLLARPERLLVTVLIVTNFLNICAVIVLGNALIVHLGPTWGCLLTLLICLPFFMSVEILSKSLFRRFPYRLLAAFAGALFLINLLLTPVLALGSWIYRIVRHQVPEERKVFCGREDFKYLTFESEREGTLTATERTMIHNVVDFRAVTAKEVMVPIEQVKTIRTQASVDELYFLAHKTGLDRFPVIGSSGEITGLVTVFEVLLEKISRGNVSHHQRRLITVAPNESGFTVIRKMRAARSRMALVAQDPSKPLGIISHEALILRLVNTATSKPAQRPL